MRRVSPRWRAIDLACWSVMPRQALSSDSPFVGRIRSLVASPPCGTCCFVPNICSSLPSWVGRLCVDRTIPQGEHRCCFYVWRWRRVAPAHEGPRNEPSNKAHEPTSGRSTHYGSGHLIRVFRDIGHIFSSPYPFIGGSVSQSLCPVRGTCYSVPNICSSLPWRQLSLPRRVNDEQWNLFSPEF